MMIDLAREFLSIQAAGFCSRPGFEAVSMLTRKMNANHIKSISNYPVVRNLLAVRKERRFRKWRRFALGGIFGIAVASFGGSRCRLRDVYERSIHMILRASLLGNFACRRYLRHSLNRLNVHSIAPRKVLTETRNSQTGLRTGPAWIGLQNC